MERGSNQFDFEERPWTDENFLKEEFYWECKSLDEIAEDFPITKHTIHNWIKKYNIERKYDDKSWLIDKYINEEKTASEIAKECGVSQPTISKRLRDKGIREYSTELCEECGKEVIDISKHWYNSDCEYRALTQKQKEILTGIVMGDGYVRTSKNRTPSVFIKMTNKKYLDYLSEKIFPVYSSGVKLEHDAEYNARRDRRSGWNPNAKKENYKDIYSLQLKSSEEFFFLSNWYSTGEKIFPNDITLTPRSLKHWFCCDGCSSEISGQKYASISANNELKYIDKLKNIFSKSNAPMPSNFVTDGSYLQIRWNKEKSNELYRYMGDAPPGFKYKWP